MNDCIFCKIIKGEISSYTIYEDNKVKAFLDINPIANGHILLIPKEHHKNFLDTPDDLIKEMYHIIKTKIYPLLQEKLQIEGLSICQIGKDVNHYHMHLIPQYPNDSLQFSYDTKNVGNIEDIYKQITKI